MKIHHEFISLEEGSIATTNDQIQAGKQIIADLQKQSAARVNASEYFTKENHRISKYEEQKNREKVTLNREKYDAERKELDPEKEEEETFEKLSDNTRPVFDIDDEYNTEALDVTTDYLRVLGGEKIVATHGETNQVESVP